MPVHKRNEARSISAGESAAPATPSSERLRRTARPKAAVSPAEVPAIEEPASVTAARAPEPAGMASESKLRPSAKEPASDRDEIARLAYAYWEARGGHGGSPEEDWQRAEQELRRRRAGL